MLRADQNILEQLRACAHACGVAEDVARSATYYTLATAAIEYA